MPSLNHTNAVPANSYWIKLNRILRLWAVGRFQFYSAALVLVLWYGFTVNDAFGWQKGSQEISSVLYGLLSCWSVGIIGLALLDTRSRFQDYKRAKDLFFENGFKPRIAKIYRHSKCQRDAARVAAKDLGLIEKLDQYYQSQGYEWYHILPDIIIKKPWIVFSRRYWQKILFQPQYTSIHFLW
jgi:hypothetical protein